MKKAGVRATQCHHMTVMKQLNETQDPVIREMMHSQVIEQLQETIKQNRMNAKKSEEKCVFDKPIQSCSTHRIHHMHPISCAAGVC